MPLSVDEICRIYFKQGLKFIRCPNHKAKFNLQHILHSIHEQRPGLQRSISAFVIFGATVRFPKTINRYVWGLTGRKWIQQPEKIQNPDSFEFALILHNSQTTHRQGQFKYLDIPKYYIHETCRWKDHVFTVPQCVHGPSRVYILNKADLKHRCNDHDDKVVQCVCEDGVILFGQELPQIQQKRILKATLENEQLYGTIVNAPITRCRHCGNETRIKTNYCLVCGQSFKG